jgi:molybdate/tungstate transport system permease protein
LNKKKSVIFSVLTIIFGIIHLSVFSTFLDIGTNAVIFIAHLLFILCGFFLKPSKRVLYIGGYLFLFLVLFLYSGRFLIFSMCLILYASLVRTPHFMVYYFIVLISVVFIPPYWIQSSLLLGFFFTLFRSIKRRWQGKFLIVSFASGFVLILFIFFPIVYLIFQSSPQTLMTTIKLSDFQRSLGLSLLTASISTLIILVFGIPLAYGMARMDFKGKGIVESLIDLPILIPQTIVGIALLVLLGPKTPIGQFFYSNFGLSIAGSILGIICAQVFVSAPFLIKSSINAFEAIDPKLENVSRNLGASAAKTFFYVTLPLALPGIFNGCILSWARALSEVGSLMVLAYHPFTIAVFSYDTFTQFGLEETKPIAILVIIICLWIFIVLRWLYSLKKQKRYNFFLC